MKKICSFLFSLALIVSTFTLSNKTNLKEISFAKEETTTYAKATSLCTLYKTQTLTDDIENIIFVIPETYFVTIIEVISDDCLKVQYRNYVGYVDSSTVIIATFIPIVKYLDGITCDIKDTSGTQIWSRPSATSSVLTTIPAGTKKISYIAMAFGKIPNGGESNVWYYINYTPESNSTNVYEGYIYSENITNLSEILSNTESNPEIIQNEIDVDDYAIYISSPVRAVIISLIAIPVIILVLIILYKITKQFKQKSTSQNNSSQNTTYNNKNFNYQNNSNFNENNNYNPNFDYNYENKYPIQNNLRNEINQMSSQSYIKKINPYHHHQNDTQIFPSYESDDDML